MANDTWTPTLTHPGQPIAKPLQRTKALVGTGPEQVTTIITPFLKAYVGGFKGNNVANSASVFIGAGTLQPIEVPAGKTILLEPAAEWHRDLSLYNIRGASGDGVVVELKDGLQNAY